MRRLPVLLLFCLGFVLFDSSQMAACAQSSLQSLGIAQGLSNNSVRSIFQDHNGLMWFGTYDGLNLYDGYSFKAFRNKLNDTNSLPHNYIYAVHEDKQHNLWVGTGQGIGIYSNRTQKFRPAYYLQVDSTNKSKITHNVTAIKSDESGNLFIATNGYGLIVKKNSEEIGHQIPLLINGVRSVNYNVRDLLVDNQRLWLVVGNIGLCSLDLKSGKLLLVNSNMKNASCLAQDKSGIMWIGTFNGLIKYSVADNSIVETLSEENGKLSSNIVACLTIDNSQKIWVGTEGGGITIINAALNKIDYLLPGEQKGMLSSESVYAVFEDNEKRKWIGTLKGGINISDPNKSGFRTYTHDPLNNNTVINKFVSCFYEEDENHIWIGTDGGGLSIWNRKENRYTHLKRAAGNPHTLSHNSITSITKDYLGNIWVATFGGGVNKYNRHTGKFEHYKCVNGETGEENKNAWLLYEDSEKNLWVTTFSRGRLYKYNRLADKFEAFDQVLSDLIAFKEDRNAVLWGGNSHQLVKIDRVNKRHEFYEMGKPIRDIHEDQNGNFWVGTEGGGLILFNRKEGKIETRYSDANGLCNNSVLNILEDEETGLWLSTFNGLSQFNIKEKVFKNYFAGDGLQSNQFIYNAGEVLNNGEMIFGGINGFNVFEPTAVQSRSFMPPVLITGIRINNRPVAEASEFVLQAKDKDQIDGVQVPYNQAVLSFDFTALEYTSPEKIKYAYYLEGLDKNWNYTGNIRTVNYNNIFEGSYTLHVKSSNAAGIWNEKEAVLSVVVLPPWYRSWWAYILYATVLLSLIYLYQRYKARQTRLEYEVKLAHLETEKEKEHNEKKISFFTDISHEFRTPLTLIINPIKDILRNNGRNKEEDLNIVYRNARRLLSLVDQLLLFQKAGTETDTLKIGKLDLYNLARNVYISFINLTKSRNIDYRFVCENENVMIVGDKEKIEIILFNLLSNAVKYVPDGGQVILEIKESDNNVNIIVRDNGPGIPDSIGDKLFERFYKVQEPNAVAKPGIGIGLYLVKHFTEQHNGNISYQSTAGSGTSFTVSLLKGVEHFNGRTIESVIPETLVEAEILHEQAISVGKEVIESEDLITNKKSILIVEDDIEIRNYLASIFKDKFTLYEAENGEKGLQITEKYLPDIVISDVMMQHGNGIQLCNNIKENESLSHIPVILLTAVDASEVKIKGVECGADDYITKPFEKDLLVARVYALLKSRTRLQNYFYNEITLKKHDLKISAEYKEFLEKCISIVESHIEDDDFSIRKLAQEIGMSHSNLYRKVKSISGQTINSFIRFIRLRKAAELMIKTNGNINEIAFQVGISDVKYFRKQFQALFEMNPSDYIKKYRPSFNKDFSISEKMVRSDLNIK